MSSMCAKYNNYIEMEAEQMRNDRREKERFRRDEYDGEVGEVGSRYEVVR